MSVPSGDSKQHASSPAPAAGDDEHLSHSAVPQTEDEEQDPSYPDAAIEELLPPSTFKPFFTLIENTESGEHHHPTVHYLFSDDDEDIFTDATLMALDQTAISGESAEVEERIVVLDMAADGKSVTSATSLSSRWQSLRATIGQAPSWGDNANAADRGLMLKISGQEASSGASRKNNRAKRESMEELVRKFGERMDHLDGVLGTSAEEGTAQEHSIQESSSNV